MPVVGEENPGGDQKPVRLPACGDYLNQTFPFRFGKFSPLVKQSARDEEEPIRQHQAAQARRRGRRRRIS